MPVKLEQLADEVIETDFLIIGGGMAGCMAAIRARLKGNIDVAVMERSAIKYSGNIMGYDDYNFLIPHPSSKEGELHGTSLKNPQLAVVQSKNYAKPLEVLEEIGVKVREDDGTIKMHRPITQGDRPALDREKKVVSNRIYYRGTDVKRKLAQAVQKSGVRVFERTLLTSLVTKDGSVVGATGINTRTGKFIVFKAKTVLLSSGGAFRLYMYPYAPFPQSIFHHRNSPLDHGGGMAVAYRAGAKLVNLEILELNYPSTAGFGTACNMAAGFSLPTKNYKGEILEQKYRDQLRAQPGRAVASPMFCPSIDASEMERDVIFADASSADKYEVIARYFNAATEWPRSLKCMKLRGGFKSEFPVENRLLVRGLMSGVGGILAVNDKAETSLKNLFAAGDTSSGAGGGGSNALIWGYIVADHIRELAPEVSQGAFGSEQVQQVEAEKERVFAPMGRKGDVDPLELEDYVRKINSNYIGIHRTEARMKRAADLMRMMRDRFVPALVADDPHGLTHTMEVQDIIQLSELHAQSSLLRTESRMGPSHYRHDYPEQDDEHWGNVVITVENVGGEANYKLEKIS